MMTDRVGGPPPSQPPSGRGAGSTSKSFKEALEKVEKISEVDPDEPSRRHKYSPIDEGQPINKKEAAPPLLSPPPGPATFGFFTPIPTPSSSHPAVGINPPPQAPSGEEAESPQAQEFWESFDAETFESGSEHRLHEGAEEEADKKEQIIRSIEEDNPDAEADKQKKGSRQRDRSLRASPIPPAVALEAETLAKTATVQASSYLNAEMQLLFEKMVGTLFMMRSTPGVLQMEILLNSPTFSSSLFYGSTITIRRYAAAANAMNIEFSGPDEAVRLFQENIPSLRTAFHNGRFSFSVGNIEAVYGQERKVRRKKGSNDDT